jgi:hypothetical protein
VDPKVEPVDIISASRISTGVYISSRVTVGTTVASTFTSASICATTSTSGTVKSRSKKLIGDDIGISAEEEQLLLLSSENEHLVYDEELKSMEEGLLF